jgi:DNA-binding Lrp family transcriptional regulator
MSIKGTIDFTSNYKLDSKDLLILQERVENCRISQKDLSIKLNVSRNTVDKRIKRLINDNIINGATIFIDYYKLGFSHYILFIEKPELYFDKSKLEILKSSPNICEIIMQYGKHNCYIRFLSKTLKEKDKIISEILNNINPISFELVESTHFDLIPSKRNYRTEVSIPKIYSIPNKETRIIKLDEIDKKILHILKLESDINYALLGRKLNLSTQLVISRIKNLKYSRVIRLFLGMSTIKNSDHTFYFLRFENRDYSKNNELFKYLVFSKHINHVDILISKKNFFCVVDVTSQDELELFIKELVQKFSQINSITLDLYVERFYSCLSPNCLLK